MLMQKPEDLLKQKLSKNTPEQKDKLEKNKRQKVYL